MILIELHFYEVCMIVVKCIVLRIFNITLQYSIRLKNWTVTAEGFTHATQDEYHNLQLRPHLVYRRRRSHESTIGRYKMNYMKEESLSNEFSMDISSNTNTNDYLQCLQCRDSNISRVSYGYGSIYSFDILNQW